eukprot:TRINITY_DN71392_c0_g1_i1.p1 TRINITY_DN71392_c0_g1~~TRINITY_DN71392_c0_g1_i1.p1  ORF type:complete len:369 (+),score=72.82 TRINITY_DN71392_c0_g1_i1:81-1109(+)
MSALPGPPPSHPAARSGHVPTDSIGPLPPHLQDIASPERQRSPPPRHPGLWPSQPPPSSVQGYYAAPPLSQAAFSPQQHQHLSSASGGLWRVAPASPASGPHVEAEVAAYLDSCSPQRIREQSPTTLPPQDYMDRVIAVAQQSGAGPPQATAPPRQSSAAASPGRQLPAQHSVGYAPASAAVSASAYPGYAVVSDGAVPPPPQPGDGESPGRLRVFGAPAFSPQRAGRDLSSALPVPQPSQGPARGGTPASLPCGESAPHGSTRRGTPASLPGGPGGQQPGTPHSAAHSQSQQAASAAASQAGSAHQLAAPPPAAASPSVPGSDAPDAAADRKGTAGSGPDE